MRNDAAGVSVALPLIHKILL